MKDRDFRKRAAEMASAALLVVGLLGLVPGAVRSACAQEAPGVTNSSAGQVVNAYLDYREVSYSFVTWPLPITTRSSAFTKEPALSRSQVTRGLLKLGGGGSNEMAFAWDRAAGKLYLDLNRNLDLADDSTGVFSSLGGARESYQAFTNIPLPFQTPAGSHQAVVDLSFFDYGRLNCNAAMRSFWQGKVTLEGQEWQVGLLGTPDEQRSSLETGNLLLRPWSERSKPFSLHSGALEAFPFSRKLFFGSQAYQVQCTNEGQGDAAKVRVQFTEQKPSLGEVKITGVNVQRVTLEGGPYMVVIDRPEATVRVPVGSYKSSKVCLRKGSAQAHLDQRTQFSAAGRITVNDTKPAVLTAGGPLTNSVSVIRQGRIWLLDVGCWMLNVGCWMLDFPRGRGVSTGEPGPLASAGVYGLSGRPEGGVGQVRVWLRRHLLVLMASTSHDRR